MNTAQKIVKYLAIAFAMVLIVGIFSGIWMGVYALGNVLGLNNKEDNSVTENLEPISESVSNISSLKIETAFTDLHIKTADSFRVETNNKNISYKENNGNIVIKEKTFVLFGNTKYTQGDLTVYLPENASEIDNVEIESGAGKVEINGLKAKTLNLDLGAGKVNLENINVSRELDISGGAGETVLKSAVINNMDADLGVGEFTFEGVLSGETEIDSGVGKINITLSDSKDNYSISADKGIGSVTADGKELSNNSTFGTGRNKIDIDGGIGAIEIKFK